MILRNTRIKRLVPAVLAGVVALALVPATAQGDTISDKRAQAAQLQSAIDENGRRTSALAEQINGAQYKLDQAQGQIAEAQARIDAAKAESNRIEGLLSERAVQIYKGAGNTSPLDAVEVANVNEIAQRRKYASAASNHDNALVDELTRSREALAAQKAQQEDIKIQAQAERDSLAAARQEIEAANARQRELLGQVKGDLAALVQQEAERREAAARARAAELTAPRSSSVGTSRDTGTDPGSYPAPSGGAAAAIEFARAQIGKPYQYAATGPDTYDCSGLTMMAWAAGGVSMPHYSGAQYSMFPRVPMDALQPGDLIAWGPGGSNHIALYVGGGTIITAPRTGDVVKYSSLYGSPVGAVRPG